jgi:hypothetical protein
MKMSQETKKNVLQAINCLLKIIHYKEIEKEDGWKDIQARYPDRKVLDRIVKEFDQIITFNVPGKSLKVFTRKFLAYTQLAKDEAIETLTLLKNKGAVIAMDIEDLYKPGMISLKSMMVVDVNKEKLVRYKSFLLGQQISENGSLTKTRPDDWKITEDENKVHIVKDGKTLFAFPSNTSNQYRYFECLWNNYSKRVPYPEIYEYKSGLKYPHRRGENYQVNDRLRNSIRKLREKFKKKKLPIKIVTNRGFTLTIEE